MVRFATGVRIDWGPVRLLSARHRPPSGRIGSGGALWFRPHAPPGAVSQTAAGGLIVCWELSEYKKIEGGEIILGLVRVMPYPDDKGTPRLELIDDRQLVPSFLAALNQDRGRVHL